MDQRVVGIDFGTSTTLVAVRDQGLPPRVLPLGHATPWMPSVVGVDDDGQLVAGERATDLEPRRQLRSPKALLTLGIEFAEVAGTQILVADAIRLLLAETLERAERQLPGILHGARVFLGCPALWTAMERRVLADVAHGLGVDVDIADLIDEPVAAGLSWVNQQWLDEQRLARERVLVFDAGGGTLDVAYLELVEGERPDFTVLSADAVPESGDVLDAAIADDLGTWIEGLPDQDLAHTLLRFRATQLKESLSVQESREIPLGAPYTTLIDYTRAQLEAVFAPQLKRALRLAASAVRGAMLRDSTRHEPAKIRQVPWTEVANEVDHVVLVGGLSQVPAVSRALADLCPGAGTSVVPRPQESVALGLALGDRLDRLNLPRPPVRFLADFSADSPSAADDPTVVYEAFTPLYTWAEMMNGNTLAGYSAAITPPNGSSSVQRFQLRCVMPDRRSTPLDLNITRLQKKRDEAGKVTLEAVSEVRDALELVASPAKPARFKLYPNGDLVVTCGSGRHHYRFRVDRWPTVRGLRHDWDRELKLHDIRYDRWPDLHDEDQWRSK